MEIGEPKPAIVIEPVEDPFTEPVKEPAVPEREKVPVKVPEREKVGV